MKHFVISHQPFDWKVPFEHIEIGVGGYTPINGIGAKDANGALLDMEVAFGGIRSARTIQNIISKSDENETVALSSYRMFLGKNVSDQWNSAVPFDSRHRIVTPEFFLENHSSLVAQELPPDIDLMICSPVAFPCSVLEQYTAHHVDDLMFAVGCAIRGGLIDAKLAARVLTNNVLIPFGLYTSKAKFRYDMTDRFLWCVDDFYRKHHIPREGAQRRSIDFAFERVLSICLYGKIISENLRVASSIPVLISQTNSHTSSI